jgi:hypothetical protein
VRFINVEKLAWRFTANVVAKKVTEKYMKIPEERRNLSIGEKNGAFKVKMKLKKFVKECVENGEKVVIVMSDAVNAWGSVDQQKRVELFEEKGKELKMELDFMRKYESSNVMAASDGLVKKGMVSLFQGCAMSPIIFSLLLEYGVIGKEYEKMPEGVLSLFYADDSFQAMKLKDFESWLLWWVGLRKEVEKYGIVFQVQYVAISGEEGNKFTKGEMENVMRKCKSSLGGYVNSSIPERLMNLSTEVVKVLGLPLSVSDEIEGDWLRMSIEKKLGVWRKYARVLEGEPEYFDWLYSVSWFPSILYMLEGVNPTSINTDQWRDWNRQQMILMLGVIGGETDLDKLMEEESLVEIMGTPVENGGRGFIPISVAARAGYYSKLYEMKEDYFFKEIFEEAVRKDAEEDGDEYFKFTLKNAEGCAKANEKFRKAYVKLHVEAKVKMVVYEGGNEERKRYYEQISAKSGSKLVSRYPSSSRRSGVGEYGELQTVRYLTFKEFEAGGGCCFKGKKNSSGKSWICGKNGQEFRSRVSKAIHALACQGGSGKKVKNTRHYAVAAAVEAEARRVGCDGVRREPRADPSEEENEGGRVNRSRLDLTIALKHRGRDGHDLVKNHEVDFSGMSCGSGELIPRQMQVRISAKETLYGEPVRARGGILVPAVFSALGFMGKDMENLMAKIRRVAKEKGVVETDAMGFKSCFAKIISRAIVCSWRNIHGREAWIDEFKSLRRKKYFVRLDRAFRDDGGGKEWN